MRPTTRISLLALFTLFLTTLAFAGTPVEAEHPIVPPIPASAILITAFFMALNFGISWANAYFVGRSWADSKAVGGWPRFMVWCAAIMSASGFSWVYLIVLVVIANLTGLLMPAYALLAIQLGYVILIPGILFTGLAIWIDSLTTAWRRRDFGSVAVAGWNTYAQIHNTYRAASAFPEFIGDIGKAFGKGGDAKGKAGLLVILLVIVALTGGILTTVAIVRKTARNYSHHVAREFAR